MSLLETMQMQSQERVDQFGIMLYEGTGVAQSLTGLGFKPDLVWLKDRDAAVSSRLTDNLRGVGEVVYSNLNNTETTEGSGITSLDINGFTLGGDASYNTVNNKYAAWCWKAGNSSGISNTDGTITSIVNAGEALSIVKYTGTGVTGTIGHGLSTTPKLVVVKRLDDVGSWYINNTDIDPTEHIRLNSTNAATVSAAFDNKHPTSTTFALRTWAELNELNGEYIAYCFTDVPGIQKIGTYTGTGAIGNVVDMGFEPAYVMIKNTSNVGNWCIYDNKRDMYNPNDAVLLANASTIETTGSRGIDFTATGFEVQDTDSDVNTNTDEYIFIAMAANPNLTYPYALHRVETGDLMITAEDAIEDINGTHSITEIGTPTRSTSVKVCGDYSILLDTNTDRLEVVSSTDFNFGSGNFSVDYWEYRHDDVAGDTLVSRDDTQYAPFMFSRSTVVGGECKCHLTSDGVSWDILNGVAMGTLIVNTWIHRAIVRSGNVIYFYQNGMLYSTEAVTASILDSTSSLLIGGKQTDKVNCNIDNFRILKGSALWTATNFNLTDRGLFYPSGTLNVL